MRGQQPPQQHGGQRSPRPWAGAQSASAKEGGDQGGPSRRRRTDQSRLTVAFCFVGSGSWNRRSPDRSTGWR
jgi:hypothetical protein